MKNAQKKVNLKKWLIAAAALVVIAVVCIAVAASRYLRVNGQLVSRQTSFLDLRGQELTPDDYTKLQEQLPRCDILWDIPIGGSRYSSNSETLPVQGMTEQDAATLNYFTQLKVLDARDCTDYAALAALVAQRPDLVCQLTLAGQTVSSDAEELSIADADISQLRSVLPLMNRLQRLELTGSLPSISDLRQLQWEYPNVTILWEVFAPGGTVISDTTVLDLSSVEMDYARAEALFSQLPLLEKVDMRGCGLTDEEMIRLTEQFPQTLFIWDLEVAGLSFPTDSVEIDISGQRVSDPAEVESLLSCFPRLERVIMSDCGLDDETMDALNRRHEDVRFVWTVYFRWWPVRTDALYFYPYKMDHRFGTSEDFSDAELYPLRYCTDMVSIDLGHNASVYNIEWAAFMPKLRYLILVQCPVTDLSPLVNCKELVYFEISTCPIAKDLSSLVECTALEDINLGWSYPDPEPLASMPWLKHVWWCSATSMDLPCAKAPELLGEALPNTVLFFDGYHPVDGGWRELQTYYDMRDLMGMRYLR